MSKPRTKAQKHKDAENAKGKECKISFLMLVSLCRIAFFPFFLTLCACASQTEIVPPPVPDIKKEEEPAPVFDTGSITETQDGPTIEYLPDWLVSYFSGGVAEVEKLDYCRDRYAFIGKSGSANFTALGKWAENFTVVHDFSRLAALRIEKRLNSQAASFPDEEYGDFYETLVKKAFNAEYPEAVKEDTYWIKTVAGEVAARQGNGASSGLYEFYVFVSMEKIKMRSIINAMMSDALSAVTPTRAQRDAITRLRNIFFEGF
ncbi:MAG: hypothetical protein LBU82_03940 [Treponema sp.]|nr:hypothetical protein [Treponema sp.]